MNRRQMLTAAAGTAALAAAPAAAAFDSADGRLAALLERHARSLQAFDGGSEADPLGDRSVAGRARFRAENTQRIAELQRVDRAALSPAARIDRDTAAFVYGVLDDHLARPGTVDLDLRPSPYVVSQMNGAYYWSPPRIGARAIKGREVYLDGVAALARGIEQESERIVHDAGQGVIPPDFILAMTAAQVRALRDSAPQANPVLAPAYRTDEALGEEGAALFRRIVAPALDRQARALDALVGRASDKAGVWAQPDGEALYTSSLYANITIRREPGELHRQGLEWVAALSAEIDADLKRLGMSQGSVGERIAALNLDPRFLQPNTDAGRAEVHRQAEAYLAASRARASRAFTHLVDTPVEVRRMSTATEDSSPVAFYNGPSGGAPGGVLLNLKTPSDLPSWRLPTLIHHEGVPGHHSQAAVLDEVGGLSAFRRAARFSAWTEGWALYAEAMSDEIGAYEADPYGRIGYLQAQLWRAGRVVVDTGLHHERWDREQAVAYMVDTVGELRGPTEREVNRYCVYPGQACCFMVGKQQIVASREAARQAMGGRFRLGDYNDLVLRSGPLPMEVLDALVQQWSAA
ncbi:bacteriochlorophyll 4-vinyl reductase [Brevundimonas naejangsanensis]|uniref:Bacteriochlorophyll 4-vinyl reductase n=1 Tax=Brevundimonas naejangsanensis TaxID=588932 RepID=A0A172Y366_9CAUL|nr:DUF885 domain-containing protein [Brevundimonas naejangsanensis]ANF53661.1 bacteriochlorophyll 4-vinyl reductase [Brevundimonas naejangsanensis]